MSQPIPPPFQRDSYPARLMILLLGIIILRSALYKASDLLDLEVYNYIAWRAFMEINSWAIYVIPVLIVFRSRNAKLKIWAIVMATLLWIYSVANFIYFEFFYSNDFDFFQF